MKYIFFVILSLPFLSLPPRERGLKSGAVPAIVEPELSLPPRERGLKFFERIVQNRKSMVAPSAGAWIEIVKIRHMVF